MFILIGSDDWLTLLFLVLAFPDDNGTVAVKLTLEVEYDICLLFEVESDDVLTRNLLLRIAWDVESQIVDDITDVGFSLGCELFRDALCQLLRIGTECNHAECCSEECFDIFHLLFGF